MRHGCLWLTLALTLCGCAHRRNAAPTPQRTDAPARLAAHPVAAVAARRISNLLNFESSDDLTFLAADPIASVRADASIMREGARSLLIPPSTRSITVKLPTLLEGRPFPADWTLVGGYFYADAPAYITATYDAGHGGTITRTVGIGARAWTPVMLDISTLGAAVTSPGTLQFAFVPTPGGSIHCDDILLVDNHHAFIDTRSAGNGWIIRRRGLAYVVEHPGRFAFAIYTAEAQQSGWSIEELDDARVRFASRGQPRNLTVYADGRAYCDGEFKSMSAAMPDANEIASAHQSPAQVSVAETLGRVNRNSEGDGDNDGYNESTGAYQVIANGPRIEVTLSPQSAPAPRPVLEISGLPPGQLLVTMEGRLILGARRLSSGNVLIELPARLSRATQVNIRVQ